jgi:hypothetical protein
MELAEGIRKFGFRRWYERQLIESHIYLVTCFLCLVAVLACFEGFSLRAPGWETLMRFAAMAGGAGVCVWALRRYLALLDFAVRAAERSVCGRCETYGNLEVTGARAGANDADPALRNALTGVRCRKCGNEWTIK